MESVALLDPFEALLHCSFSCKFVDVKFMRSLAAVALDTSACKTRVSERLAVSVWS